MIIRTLQPGPPTSALTLFYSARSYEQLDLLYFTLSAKLQDPPEVKVSQLFRSKVGDLLHRTYVATAPIYIGAILRVPTAQPHNSRTAYIIPDPGRHVAGHIVISCPPSSARTFKLLQNKPYFGYDIHDYPLAP